MHTSIQAVHISILMVVVSLAACSNAGYVNFSSAAGSGYICNVERSLQNLPSVIYFDDAGVENADPNGLQELPIVMGLHRQKVNLLAIATRLTNLASRNLFNDIVASSKHHDVDIIVPSAIAQRIVDESKCILPGRFLYVAIGGEWYEMEEALKLDASISERIVAIGWQVANGDSGRKQASYDKVRELLSERAVAIDTLDMHGNPVLSGGYPQSQYFSSGHKSLKTFHVFRQSTDYSAINLDDFYNSHLQPILGDFADNQNRNITDESEWYIREAVNLNRQPGSPGPGTATKTKLRVADFLTIAYVLDKSKMFNTQAMRELIEEAVENF